jgi:putative transposase
MRFLAGNHSVFSIHYHLVLVTKYRHKCITPEMASRIDELVAIVCKNSRCELLEANGEADHRHFLISATPAIAPAKLVNAIKTNTSRLIRKEYAHHLKAFYWKPVFWSRSYCLVSAGGAPLSVIQQYIQNQGAA